MSRGHSQLFPVELRSWGLPARYWALLPCVFCISHGGTRELYFPINGHEVPTYNTIVSPV
jgi:hypothetical protein